MRTPSFSGWLLGSCLVLVTAPHRQADDHSFTLKTQFHTNGVLILNARPGPMAHPRSLHFEGKDGTYKSLGGLGDLRGRVRIESRAQALNFVRLRGSPALVHVLRDYPVECEVVDRDQVDPSFVFGAKDVLTYLRRRPLGMFGFGNQSLLDKSDVREASVAPLDGKYRITRTLLTMVDGSGFNLETVTETVSPDGDYSFKVLRSVPTSGIWSFDFPL